MAGQSDFEASRPAARGVAWWPCACSAARWAAARGVEELPWLFTGTFVAMLLAVPVFGALSARYPRRTLLPIVYAFFIGCILALFAAVRSAAASTWAPVARRLFGFIAAGGSAGALLGPALAAVLAPRIGPANLLPIAAVILALALLCVARLRKRAIAARGEADDAAPVGGGALGGIVLIARSRYLLGICAFMAIATMLSTFVYFQQARVP